MRKIAFLSLILPCALALIVSAQSLQRDSQKSAEQTKWIAESLREMQTVEVGKTRADLLRVFTTEGGLATRLNQTFVYRNCPYIKVRVEFEAARQPAPDVEGRVTAAEDAGDKIKSISKPYLEWSVNV